MPLFSIVVPTYNPKYIEETINSFLTQTCTDYEIIIVDDGSDKEYLDKILKFEGKIRFFRQENMGSTYARNKGIQEAKGEYIVSFDHDDIMFHYALRIYKDLIEYLNSPPFIVAKMTWFSHINELFPQSNEFGFIKFVKYDCFFKKNKAITFMNSNMVIKRSLLEKIGYYPHNSFAYDDYRLVFRIGNISPLISIENPSTVGYRKHDSWSRNPEYLSKGVLALIDDERKFILPGGKEYKLDRKGLIATSTLSIFKHYLGLKNFNWIIKLLFKIRFMIFYGPIRKVISLTYNSKVYEIKSFD